jgi:hypothetical protein
MALKMGVFASEGCRLTPAADGWLRRAATGEPAELLRVDRAMRAGAELGWRCR